MGTLYTAIQLSSRFQAQIAEIRDMIINPSINQSNLNCDNTSMQLCMFSRFLHSKLYSWWTFGFELLYIMNVNAVNADNHTEILWIMVIMYNKIMSNSCTFNTSQSEPLCGTTSSIQLVFISNRFVVVGLNPAHWWHLPSPSAALRWDRWYSQLVFSLILSFHGSFNCDPGNAGSDLTQTAFLNGVQLYSTGMAIDLESNWECI